MKIFLFNLFTKKHILPGSGSSVQLTTKPKHPSYSAHFYLSNSTKFAYVIFILTRNMNSVQSSAADWQTALHSAATSLKGKCRHTTVTQRLGSLIISCRTPKAQFAGSIHRTKKMFSAPWAAFDLGNSISSIPSPVDRKRICGGTSP